MSKTASKTKKSVRSPLALDLPTDLRSRLKAIAVNNSLPVSTLARMCINSGLPLVESKLSEMKPALAS